MAETDKVMDIEFKWGKKRGVGGKKKEARFYESFTYDGVEYSLYDCVYMHKEGEPEPYIGKLIKIWETAGKTKKVKVQWFFRPFEILRWLGDEMTLENEIFLASGEGLGLANVNPLESIAGKSNVVCISKDSRNYQPTEEELKMADYVFYRTFDVGLCTLSDKMDDKVGGLEIKFIFNRTEGENASGIPKLVFDRKEENKNAIACDGNELLSIQYTPDELVSLKTRADYNQSVAANDVKDSRADYNQSVAANDVKDSLKCESLPEVKPASGSGVNSNALATTSVQQASALGQKVTTCKVDVVKDEVRNKVKAEERQKSAKDTDVLEDRPTKKARIEDSIKSPVDKSINSSQKVLVQGNDMMAMLTTAATSDEKTQSGHDKNPLRQDKGVKSATELADLENRPSKKAKVDSSVKKKSRNNIQKVSVNSDGNHSKDLVTSDNSYEGRTKSRIAMDSFGQKSPSKEEKLEENTRNHSSGKLPMASASDSGDEDRETDRKFFEVTRRPDADKSKWFRTLPFEERLQNGHEKGTIVLLQNLDPEYTSGEVQDIIWHAFGESCTAKMVQWTSISSPHSGQAIVIFKTREATVKVIKRLSEGCLMLPNGRPLVGSTGPPINFRGKQSTYYGHLVIDNKLQLQREMKDAVSTSHCSQPNTIEYDMAMEWCLLQSRSDSWWKMLYKQQGQELRKLKANLKSK